jgi:transcriptional regulator of NAD metabolism
MRPEYLEALERLRIAEVDASRFPTIGNIRRVIKARREADVEYRRVIQRPSIGQRP